MLLCIRIIILILCVNIQIISFYSDNVLMLPVLEFVYIQYEQISLFYHTYNLNILINDNMHR